MNRSESILELVKALAAARAEVEPIKKTAENPYYGSRYAPLDNIISATVPSLLKHGLVLIMAPADGVLEWMLVHTSGEWISGAYPIHAVSQDGATATPQACGSAITYARRYVTAAILNVAAEDDDDANSASGVQARTATPQKPSTPPATTPPPSTSKAHIEAPRCKVCAAECRFVEGGVAKSGREYAAFWACPNRCKGGSWGEAEWLHEQQQRKDAKSQKAQDNDIPF